MNSNICHYCLFCPAQTCKNKDSFKYNRRVTKGMTCSKFESEKEQEAA